MASIRDKRKEYQSETLSAFLSPAKRRFNSVASVIDQNGESHFDQNVSGLDSASGGLLLDIYRETRLEDVSPVAFDGMDNNVQKVEKTTPEQQFTEAQKRAWKIKQLKLTGSRTRAALDIACSYVDAVEDEEEHNKRLALFGSFLKCQRKHRQPVNLLAVDDGLAVSGVWRCHSKWICPDCAQRGLWAETQRLKALLLAIQRENVERAITGAPRLIALLVTLTAPHRAGEDLRQQMAVFSKAYGKTLHSTPIRRARDMYGFLGSVRCYDHTVTLAENSAIDWHTHLHNLLIFETDDLEPGTEALEAFGSLLFEQWRKYVSKAYKDGRQAVKQAFNVEYVSLEGNEEHSAAAVADYAAKLAVLPGYMTKGTKGAPLDCDRRKSLAPYDLLDIYNATGAPDIAAAWVAYCDGTKGFHRVDFSSGLLDRFGLRNERETATACYVLPADVAAVALASPLVMSDIKAGILDGDISRLEALLTEHELSAEYAKDIAYPGEYEAPLTTTQLEQARDTARRLRKGKNND